MNKCVQISANTDNHPKSTDNTMSVCNVIDGILCTKQSTNTFYEKCTSFVRVAAVLFFWGLLFCILHRKRITPKNGQYELLQTKAGNNDHILCVSAQHSACLSFWLYIQLHCIGHVRMPNERSLFCALLPYIQLKMCANIHFIYISAHLIKNRFTAFAHKIH